MKIKKVINKLDTNKKIDTFTKRLVRLFLEQINGKR